MKKILTIFSLLLSSCFLFGCSSYESSGNNTSIQGHNFESSFQNDEIEKDIIQSETESSTPMAPTSINIQTPPESNSYLFDSYNDLSKALTEQDFSTGAASNTYGELFDKTITAFKNNTIDLYVPAIDEDVCTLRNKEGFSNIALMTTELYNLPWIWYHCKVNDDDVDVRIAYPSVIENHELNSAKTYYEVLKLIAPDAPSPDNYAKYESYQKIYESEICLANGKKVAAMVSELKSKSKVYIMFKYEDALVCTYADKSVLTESFWSRFSLAKYDIDEPEPVSPPVIDSDTTVFQVGSLAQYAELKDVLNQDDNSLEKFFKTLSSGKKDRETANVFVKHVDSLSVPDFFPGKITWIRYEKSEKEDNYETVQITIQTDSAGWIRYCYYIPSDENAVPFPDTDQSSVFEEPLQNDDGSIKLFSKSVKPHHTGKGYMISLTGSINGINTSVTHYTPDADTFSEDDYLSSSLIKIDDFKKFKGNEITDKNKAADIGFHTATFMDYSILSENYVRILSNWEEEMTQERAVTTYVSRLMFKAEDLNYIKVPKFADNDLKLIDSDGIVLNSKDLYERPALIFNYDNNVSVKLTDVENERIDFDQVDTSAFIEKMNSVCEDKALWSSYDNVRVEKTEIKGRTAEVLFGSNKGDSNVYAVFVYDDYLVTLCCSQEDIESGLLSSFRLKELELSEQINSDATNPDNTNVVDAKDILLIGYDDKTNSESTEKLPRIALKCNSFSNLNELFDVDIALGDESFSTEDFNNGVIYSQEIYVCDPVNYKDIHDEKFYVNNVNSKYQMEYSKGEIKVFNISERYNDYDSYRHVTASLDFSKYNVGDCGIINFEFTKYFADTTYIQDRKFIYFFVGENGVYLSGTGIEDAKKASQTT